MPRVGADISILTSPISITYLTKPLTPDSALFDLFNPRNLAIHLNLDNLPNPGNLESLVNVVNLSNL